MKKPKENLSVIIVILVVALLFSLSYFWVGLHNTDHCHNLELLNCEHELGLSERTVTGDIWTAEECYLTGLSQLIVGAVASVMIGIALGLVVGRVE